MNETSLCKEIKASVELHVPSCNFLQLVIRISKINKGNRALQAHQYDCYMDFVRFVIPCTAPWDRTSL